ncbi:ABC transporter permease [Streptomyces sp. NRRL F-5126]|uniref:ABC transporter permease n=1 Tax=Streptomyces sp. NRRL F-5126 TaxID=1463857 RepID=UPI0004C9BA86|nr:ABC transporter permease [Streptomyces sp. NRRL F-5126]
MTTVQTSTRPAAAAPARREARRPSLLRMIRARAALEIKQFYRSKGQMLLSFSLPLIMYILFSTIFSGDIDGTSVTAGQLYATGMLAMGVAATSFQSLALQVSLERQNGALKRLRGTPMPPTAYFVGKIAVVLVTSLGQAAVLLIVGSAFFHLHLPTGAGPWMNFLWLYALGIAGCSLLGLAFSTLIKGDNGGGPMVVLPFMVVQFISGVFIPFQELPHYLQQVAALLPLKWLAQGMRSVFLPHAYAANEVTGQWETGRTALVLGAWVVGGLVLCLLTFRWKNRDDG